MTTPMTSRQRVLAAIERRTPDRVPIDIGGASFSTLIDGAYDQLKAALGIQAETQYMKARLGTVALDERIARRLHADTRPLFAGPPDVGQDRPLPAGGVQDEFGVIWQRAGDGHYAPVVSPLQEAELTELRAYRWPDPLDPGRTRGLAERARRLWTETDYAVVLSLTIGYVHLSQYLRGYSTWLMDTILNPAFLEELMDQALDWWLQHAAAMLDAVGPYVDVVAIPDDVAFQDRAMVDLKTYRRLFKPRHKQMVDLVKARSNARVLYHCCGAVSTLVDEFADIGVDALNPVQVSARGMDTADLKARFGDHMTFWGSVDTSRILPHGTPADVRAEVQRRIADLHGPGGFVVAAVHNIQADVPPENILALADAAYEAG